MNTNFQTIHQMGSAISDFVKQATGRDNVQNIDMDHVTVAQNHVYEEVDISGQAVRFNAGAAGLAFEKLLVQIKPVQAGSGDPSPDNIRPITGWTMVNLYRAGQNLENARVFRFTFPSEAGVVYGGTLDAVTGKLVVDRARYTFTGRENQYVEVSGGRVAIKTTLTLPSSVNAICNEFFVVTGGGNYFYLTTKMTAQETKTYVENHEVYVIYELAEPITYQLTPQQITTLLGQNNIWADTGDIEVKFTNLKELY